MKVPFSKWPFAVSVGNTISSVRNARAVGWKLFVTLAVRILVFVIYGL
jgi:hypothetical protein